jgi:copper chaperone CopZ
MKKITIKVEDMMCEHCKKTIEDALKKLKGVNSTKVYLDNKSIEIVYNEGILDSNKIEKTILELGFSPKIND